HQQHDHHQHRHDHHRHDHHDALIRPPMHRRLTALALPVLVALLGAATAGATTPLTTTREDFRLPGTQPLSLADPIAVPSTYTPSPANYGQPNVEPFRNW